VSQKKTDDDILLNNSHFVHRQFQTDSGETWNKILHKKCSNTCPNRNYWIVAWNVKRRKFRLCGMPL